MHGPCAALSSVQAHVSGKRSYVLRASLHLRLLGVLPSLLNLFLFKESWFKKLFNAEFYAYNISAPIPPPVGSHHHQPHPTATLTHTFGALQLRSHVFIVVESVLWMYSHTSSPISPVAPWIPFFIFSFLPWFILSSSPPFWDDSDSSHLYSSWSWVLPSKSSRVRGSQTELVLDLGIAAGQFPGWFSNKLEDGKGAQPSMLCSYLPSIFFLLFIFWSA